MMLSDKKKMAMLIIGKGDKDSNMESKQEDMVDKGEEMDEDSDMQKEALNFCAKKLLKGVDEKSPEMIIDAMKKMMNLLSDSNDDDEEDNEDY